MPVNIVTISDTCIRFVIIVLCATVVIFTYRTYFGVCICHYTRLQDDVAYKLTSEFFTLDWGLSFKIESQNINRLWPINQNKVGFFSLMIYHYL